MLFSALCVNLVFYLYQQLCFSALIALMMEMAINLYVDIFTVAYLTKMLNIMTLYVPIMGQIKTSNKHNFANMPKIIW